MESSTSQPQFKKLFAKAAFTANEWLLLPMDWFFEAKT
jgi:hypothetical protein